MFISIEKVKKELVGNTIQSVEVVVVDKDEAAEITVSLGNGSTISFVAQFDHNCQRESISFWKE